MALLTIDPFNNLEVGNVSNSMWSVLTAVGFSSRNKNINSDHYTIVSDNNSNVLRMLQESNWKGYSLEYNVSRGGIITLGCRCLTNLTTQAGRNTISGYVNIIDLADHVNTRLEVREDGIVRFGGIESTDPVFNIGNYNYIEIEYDYSTRNFKVWINDALAIEGTSPSQSTLRRITFGRNESGHHLFIGDIYILDNTGPAPFNSRLGPIKTKSLPFNQITSNNWTTDSTKTKLEILNNRSQSDVDIISDPGTNAADMYTLDTSSLTETDEVLATVTTIRSNVTNFGTELVNTIVSDGININKQPHRQYLDYTNSRQHISETAPDGTAWDKTKLANTEFGYELS